VIDTWVGVMVCLATRRGCVAGCFLQRMILDEGGRGLCDWLICASIASVGWHVWVGSSVCSVGRLVADVCSG
jgi:hypothetical protein